MAKMPVILRIAKLGDCTPIQKGRIETKLQGVTGVISYNQNVFTKVKPTTMSHQVVIEGLWPQFPAHGFGGLYYQPTLEGVM